MKKELTDLFKGSEISEAQNFNSIKISLASPEKIKSWTFGEIKKPETINYRTFRPEKWFVLCKNFWTNKRLRMFVWQIQTNEI